MLYIELKIEQVTRGWCCFLIKFFFTWKMISYQDFSKLEAKVKALLKKRKRGQSKRNIKSAKL